MNNYIISTDSGCDLNENTLKENNIYCISLKYYDESNQYTDSMKDSETIKFYENIKEGKLFKTSAANIYEAYYYLKDLLKVSNNIIHLSMGSKISSTYGNFLEATNLLKENYPDANIKIIDTTLASVGYGMLAIEAAKYKKDGWDMDDVIKYIENEKRKISPFYTTSTLKYLCLGGRVSKASMIIGNALSIKPILRLNYDGELKILEKAKGTKGSYRKIEDEIAKNIVNPKDQTLYICHSNDLEHAKILGEQLLNKFSFKDIKYTFIGPTIGSHAGPGLIAAFFHGKERLK